MAIWRWICIGKILESRKRLPCRGQRPWTWRHTGWPAGRSPDVDDMLTLTQTGAQLVTLRVTSRVTSRVSAVACPSTAARSRGMTLGVIAILAPAFSPAAPNPSVGNGHLHALSAHGESQGAVPVEDVQRLPPDRLRQLEYQCFRPRRDSGGQGSGNFGDLLEPNLNREADTAFFPVNPCAAIWRGRPVRGNRLAIGSPVPSTARTTDSLPTGEWCSRASAL